MILLATTWLGLAVLLCAFAWMAGRRLAAFSLPLAVALAALSVYIPTGSPRYTAPPPGKYTVLGARIDVNVAIWALLDDGKGAPTFYKLPYSTSAANSLQQALDGAQNGQGVEAQIDGEGGATYDGDPPVTGTETKTPETPAISLP
jgi:hypothetical protein